MHLSFVMHLCSVTGCSSNYRKQLETSDYIPVYKLPKVPEQRDIWLHNIPRENMPSGKETVVCRKHWPENVEFITVPGGHKRPVGPPTVFPGVPKSKFQHQLLHLEPQNEHQQL